MKDTAQRGGDLQGAALQHDLVPTSSNLTWRKAKPPAKLPSRRVASPPRGLGRASPRCRASANPPPRPPTIPLPQLGWERSGHAHEAPHSLLQRAMTSKATPRSALVHFPRMHLNCRLRVVLLPGPPRSPSPAARQTPRCYQGTRFCSSRWKSSTASPCCGTDSSGKTSAGSSGTAVHTPTDELKPAAAPAAAGRALERSPARVCGREHSPGLSKPRLTLRSQGQRDSPPLLPFLTTRKSSRAAKIARRCRLLSQLTGWGIQPRVLPVGCAALSSGR